MARTRSEIWGTALVAAAATGWGSWALFLRGHGLSPLWQSAMILLVMGLVSLPFALRGPLRHPGRTWRGLLLLGFLDAGTGWLYFGALDRGPIAVAVLTHYLAPVVVSVVAPFYLREPLGRRTPVALVAALFGLCLLVFSGGGLSGAALPAAILGSASALFYGGNVLVGKKLLGTVGTAQVLSFHSLVSAALLALGAVLVRDPLPPLQAFLWLPLLGALLAGAGGGALFFHGLSLIPSQRAAVLSYLEPLVASVVGALVFGEALGPLGLVGGALILGGGALVALTPSEPALSAGEG